MARYLFSSHDGFGLGHVRRNALIARALLDAEPDAEVVLVTGVAKRPSWLGDPRLRIVEVPPLVKDGNGAYRNGSLGFDAAIRHRAEVFDATIAKFRPDVVVVDRHPYGTAGELRPGLESAARAGASLVLGLRDILDEPGPVRAELAGRGWDDVTELFDEVLVYGEQHLCDHVAEYGLPATPTYCGWVVEPVAPSRRDRRLVVVSAGGGGDGDAVFEMALDLSRLLPDRRLLLTAGPYATEHITASERVVVQRDVPGCGEVFAGAGAVVQMAGYNSTVESLAAGLRPVLVPRRSPRREQAIRASRLAALGLADVVDEGAPADEVAWLLRRPRLVEQTEIARRGLRLDGARRAAERIASLAGAPVR